MPTPRRNSLTTPWGTSPKIPPCLRQRGGRSYGTIQRGYMRSSRFPQYGELSLNQIRWGFFLIRVVCLPLNPQFLHPKTQSAGINSQYGGGSGLAMHYPVRLFKNANDMRSLHLL